MVAAPKMAMRERTETWPTKVAIASKIKTPYTYRCCMDKENVMRKMKLIMKNEDIWTLPENMNPMPSKTLQSQTWVQSRKAYQPPSSKAASPSVQKHQN